MPAGQTAAFLPAGHGHAADCAAGHAGAPRWHPRPHEFEQHAVSPIRAAENNTAVNIFFIVYLC